ncbi:MAG: cytochrome c1 [Paramuribaculum sp.]|nr:cytochrome c1 [Paramuribaculum sp.]
MCISDEICNECHSQEYFPYRHLHNIQFAKVQKKALISGCKITTIF